ncbi:HAMP domain-containing sensor histidine kinase [uncultured Anaerococcus sp.]|uniref:sensor histidine kinase n=1 Tax=uncultured Anaerococcus sp. TaxID=293428 RepID=UPI0026090BA1|nr:HAMP domain-containing sensor histidine kinase [uncultured Anaerococcus sp.]
MGNRKSLGLLISKYAIVEIAYSMFILLLSVIIFNNLINSGYIYPANYAESNIAKVEDSLKNDDFTTEYIPYYYDYIYIKDDKIIANTIDSKDQKYVDIAQKEGESSTNSLINRKYFKKIKSNDKSLILSYKLSAISTSKNIYEKVNNIELIYMLTFFLLWLIIFSLLIRHSVKILKNEIKKIAKTNEQIQAGDLNFRREDSKYSEIYGVLNSLDIIANDLKESLNEQWEIEQKQKDLIDNISHDIRTPITLIRGNTELIKEDCNPNQLDYINDIEIGLDRLNIYVDKLRSFSLNSNTYAHIVDEEMISYWIKLAESIASNKNIYLVVTKKDPSIVKLDKEQIATALQNVIVNATEHSPKKSKLYLSFKDKNDYYMIEIKDEGSGFKKEILDQVPLKYLTTKKDNTTIHGLGLSIASDIIKNNGGTLLISNYEDKDNYGACLKFLFKKSKLPA